MEKKMTSVGVAVGRTLALSRGYIYWWAALSSLVVLTLMIAALARSQLGYALLAFVTIVIALPWLFACLRGRLDPFEPIYALSFFWFLYYVIGPVYQYYRGGIHEFGITIGDVSWHNALFIIGLSISAFTVGYYLRREKPREKRHSLRWIPPSGLMPLMIGFWAFTVGWRIYLITQGWYFFADTTREVPHGLISILFFAGSVWIIAYAYFAVEVLGTRRRRVPGVLFFGLVFSIEFTLWFLSGYRSMILALVSIPLIVLWYKRGFFPTKTTTVAVAMMVLAVLLPINTLYRLSTIDASGVSRDPGADFLNTLSLAFDTAWQYPHLLIPLSPEESQANFLARLEGASTMAALIERIKPEDYLLGETFKWLGAVFIPNAVWPEKSDEYRSRQDEFCEFLNVSFRPCPAVMTQLGELYWNFGAPGTIIGMFFYGLIYRVFYSACGAAGLFGLWLYSSFWFRFVFMVEGGVIGQAQSISRQLVIMVAIIFISIYLRRVQS